jgi:N-acetylglucosaminyl-diphospho-decaprenol L-rhamnosyltransferase
MHSVSSYFPEDIAFITVAFQSRGVIPAMWESLPKKAELIIIDNGAPDGLAEWAASNGVAYRRMVANLGFGAACNEGAKLTQARWLFFINPDVRLVDPSLSSLFRAFVSFPESVAFGPVLVDANGNKSFKARSPVAGIKTLPSPEGVYQPISCLSGAALIVRRDAFEAIGGFDPSIFLYFEDDDICFRLVERYGHLVLIRNFEVIHLGAASTEGVDNLTAIKEYHYARSEFYLIAKHLGSFHTYLLVIKLFFKSLNLMKMANRRYRSRQISRLHGVMDLLFIKRNFGHSKDD